jgi:hypothetical protein
MLFNQKTTDEKSASSSIYVTTAPSKPGFAQEGTGDTDYAARLVTTINQQNKSKDDMVTFIPSCKTEAELYKQILTQTPAGKKHLTSHG